MPRYYMGVDWADTTHAIWVGDETGAKVREHTVPHTAEGVGCVRTRGCPTHSRLLLQHPLHGSGR